MEVSQELRKVLETIADMTMTYHNQRLVKEILV
jgi:hypothetical protein